MVLVLGVRRLQEHFLKNLYYRNEYFRSNNEPIDGA